MDMDDELRRAGEALDDASRRHRQGTWPSGDGRAAWLAIAATLLVVGVVIAGLLAFGRGRNESDAVIVPGAGSAAETTAVITTPETDPPTTRGPVVLDTGYRCLTSQPVQAGGLEFQIVRFPECSGSPLVMLRVGGTTSVTCTGPLEAHLSDGTTFGFRYSSKYWDTFGEWAPIDPSGPSSTVLEGGVPNRVQYAADPGSLFPIDLPTTAAGDLVFSIEVQCPDSTPIGTVDIPFTLTPAAPVDAGIVRVDRDTKFYGPCGNSSAEFSGETWYPLLQSEVALIDPSQHPEPAPPSAGFSAPKVAPPGPGDDVGTFVVYSDGLARFESESGVVTWFSQVVHQYNWEC
jgi:hypothetical protein